MGTRCDQPTAIDHRNAIGMANGGQPMRNDDHRAPRHQSFERQLHHPLAFRVKRTGGFVEQEYGTIRENSAGDGQTLALPAGQPHAAFAEITAVTLGQLVDELRGIGGLAGSAHVVVASIGAPIAHVVGHAGREDDRILRHQRHAGPQCLRIGAPDIHAIDTDGARLRIVEPQQQLEHRGLAGTRGPDQRHLFACCYIE